MSTSAPKHSGSKNQDDPAVSLIRSKISAIYGDEPSAKRELQEVEEKNTQLSKHQRYMKELGESGISMAEVQTKWHEYYQSLPDPEKHEVWKEFYQANEQAKTKKEPADDVRTKLEHPPKEGQIYKAADAPKGRPRTAADLRKQITKKVARENAKKLSASQNFKSLLFGLGLGSIVLVVFLFSFFNERFIAPFITPSRNVSSTPVIIDPNSTAAGPENVIVIPKINVEVPVVYDVASVQENAIQSGLERGVVHYTTTSKPGEQGNTVIVGHSSNNLLNSGKYKFAFVLLNRLENGDTLSLTKDGKRYVYKVTEKKIVKPTDVSVLGSTDKSIVTLITCDPPGTSINRLIIRAEQILPDPVTNVASTAQTASATPTIVPGNAPSLWSRIVGWFSS